MTMQTEPMDHFLLAYFLSETRSDGEQVRFAVSDSDEPTEWTPLAGGTPILRSSIGERGVRDPFLVRLRNGGFVLIATDLRVWPDQDWSRAVRGGSRSIVVWESPDLVTWTGPVLHQIAPPEAGNTWAPKAFWSARAGAWLVFWASALFPEGSDRRPGTYQRILVAETRDFRTFGEPRVHLDFGHDVIDLTFLEHEGRWYRFSANAHSPDPTPDRGHHIFEEVGSALEDPEFTTLAVDIGKAVMARAEGPATARHPSKGRWYLLADEFGLRGYQVFETDDLASGIWNHRSDAGLPVGARHGSLLAITTGERDRMLAARWT
jgi:hypothetical protein